MNNSRLAKELERYNLGHFIPVVDKMVDAPYFLLEDNAVGFFLSATLLLDCMITNKTY